jgi:hypothetical protein
MAFLGEFDFLETFLTRESGTLLELKTWRLLHRN